MHGLVQLVISWTNSYHLLFTSSPAVCRCMGAAMFDPGWLVEFGSVALSCFTLSRLSVPGAGIAQWLERRTRNWKVAGSNPCWSGGIIFFSRVDFLCWLLFRYSFHPRVTAVARKRSRSFCQKCRGRLELNTHTPYVCGFAWSGMEHGCMVYTELAPRRLQFHVAPAMPAL